MKKQERTWKEYKFRFSDMRLTVIDGPGAEWVCVLAGWRKQLPDPKKRVGRQRVGDVAKPGRTGGPASAAGLRQI